MSGVGEHLDYECDDLWNCDRLHRIMASAVEDELLRYPGEWVLFDRRGGVKYHGPDLLPLGVQAQRDFGLDGASKLVIYRVPEPGTSFFQAVSA